MMATAPVAFGEAGDAGAAKSSNLAANNAQIEAKIIALERGGWTAWMHNDASWFEANTDEGFISISSDGISSKAEVVQSTATGCKVAGFTIDGFRFVRLDENAILLTYTATQDAVCNGAKAPANLHVAVNYIRRGDRWLEAMYMQAP
jgi:hypothetical protein